VKQQPLSKTYIPDGNPLVEAQISRRLADTNVGTCAWSPSFSFVFVGGERLTAPASVGLSGYVNPGRRSTVGQHDRANQNGHYQGYWNTRSGRRFIWHWRPGAKFILGGYQRIGPLTLPMISLPLLQCRLAEYSNSCLPGSQGAMALCDELDHPVMENGKTEDQAGLLSVRKMRIMDSSGHVPALRSGRRSLPCADQLSIKSYSCNVVFRLEYQIGGGSINTLGYWNEVYEGKYFPWTSI